MENMIQIKERLRVARKLQNNYVDIRCKPLEFEVEDKVMLKETHCKFMIRFGKRGKLNPQYTIPFEFLDIICYVVYLLKLPQDLDKVHDIFHLSNLKKCLSDDTNVILIDETELSTKLHLVEEPMEIMD